MNQQKISLFDRIYHMWLKRPYKLHYIDHGGKGPVIILLHGIASSSANWDNLVPLINDKYRCITIDLLGFGASPKPQWSQYTMEDHIGALERTINSLRIGKRFTLAGHSLGSLLATRYASRHQSQVKRLLLLSPPAYAPLESIKNFAARQMTSFYLNAFEQLRSNKMVTPEAFNKLRQLLPPLKSVELNDETWTPFVRSLEQCIENQTLVDDIRNIQSETDVFFGVFDEVLVPYNVRQLSTISNVKLYPLSVQHAVGKRYARAVASVLVNATSK